MLPPRVLFGRRFRRRRQVFRRLLPLLVMILLRLEDLGLYALRGRAMPLHLASELLACLLRRFLLLRRDHRLFRINNFNNFVRCLTPSFRRPDPVSLFFHGYFAVVKRLAHPTRPTTVFYFL